MLNFGTHIRMFLSFFDLLWFGRYLATINTTKDKEQQWKNNCNLSLLRLQRFGNTANPDKKNITNVSDYKFSSIKEFEKFEVLFAQLQNHRPCCSVEKHSALNAKLNDLAYAYCGTPIDVGDFLIHKECF